MELEGVKIYATEKIEPTTGLVVYRIADRFSQDSTQHAIRRKTVGDTIDH